ncbi:small integral membrane protein 12 [Cephus cinctus]|uniref:Small integral membrane protein 12 n=1 Tax=Cephus cinctus TaxID=211228 RepID=A0AAJ7BIU2_CEPCN|nr:small integral membrane protein 12 [Cephus cinctus]
MWPIVMGVLRRYAPYVTLPFAGVIGFFGYHVEGWISDRYTPATAPISQQRQDRLLDSIDTVSSKKKHNPLEVNLSPSLS